MASLRYTGQDGGMGILAGGAQGRKQLALGSHEVSPGMFKESAPRDLGLREEDCIPRLVWPTWRTVDFETQVEPWERHWGRLELAGD